MWKGVLIVTNTMVDNGYSIVNGCNIMGRHWLLVTIATDRQRPFNDQQATNGPPWPFCHQRQSVDEQPTCHQRSILINAKDDQRPLISDKKPAMKRADIRHS